MGVLDDMKHVTVDAVKAALEVVARAAFGAALKGEKPTAAQIDAVGKEMLAAARTRTIAEVEQAAAAALLPEHVAEMYTNVSKVLEAFEPKGTIEPIGVVEEVESDDFERIVVENKEREAKGDIIR